MTRIAHRTCCTTVFLIILGCRGQKHEFGLPSGVTPASYVVRKASEPRHEEPSRLTPVVYKVPAPEPPKPPRLLPAPSTSPAQTYAYAADHQWLVGCLNHDEATGHWSVRYAAPGTSDRFGGELILVRPGPMSGFYPGQLVRVEGELIDPEPHQIRPKYRVKSLQLVHRGG